VIYQCDVAELWRNWVPHMLRISNMSNSPCHNTQSRQICDKNSNSKHTIFTKCCEQCVHQFEHDDYCRANQSPTLGDYYTLDFVKTETARERERKCDENEER